MAERDVTSWIPNLLGPLDLEVEGAPVDVPRRSTFNFVGMTVTDDPDNDRTNIEAAGGGTPAPGTKSYVLESFDVGAGSAVRWGLRDRPTITNTGTGTLNNIATTDANGNQAEVIRWNGDTASNASITSLANPTQSRRLVICNANSGETGNLTLKHEAGTGTAANRIRTNHAGSDIVLRQGEAAILAYDSTSSRWRVVGLAVDPLGGIGFGVAGEVLATNGTEDGFEWVAVNSFTAPTGTGVATVTSGALDAASSIGTGLQILRTNAGATDVEWVSPSDGTIAAACTLEQFGAVGDGVTDDSAAWDAAASALNAGTYGVLLLGATTYLVGSADFSFGFAIIGHGPKSVLKTTSNLPIIRMYDADAGDRAKTTLLRDFKMLGNSTGTYQYGIESGTFGNDGSSRLQLFGLTSQDMGGAGFAWSQGATTGIGPEFVGCRAISCLYGFYAGDQANLVGCQAASCDTGIYVQAGNVNWTGGDITGSGTRTIHIDANANDGHGQFTSCNLNHNPGAEIYIEAIANGHTFTACHIYETPIEIAACTGLVQFTNCVLDVTVYTMSGLVKFDSCRFDSDYFSSYNESGTPDVEFVNCRSISGALPSFVYDRVQVHYTFPSDANQTLSAQDSRAEILVIQDGVATASRTLTLALPPTKGRQIQIVNLNAYVMEIKWSSGTGLNVGAGGTGMVIGADGTNALELGAP